ncbi:MAG: ubiquitin-activating E1 FCCH domain-containing protein, partial [bacterium]
VGTGITVTASAVTGINSGSGFLATDVGRQIRIGVGYGIITARTNTTVVTITITTAIANSNANADWSLGSFSTTTGFPSCVSFFEQRLVFAASINNPQTVYFSKSGDYENMDANIGGTVADDDAIIYTIASNQVNAIRFLTSARTLIIGTAGGEFVVSGGGDNNAVTPTNIMIKKQSNHGAANVDAISVGNATLFLQRAKRKIRELAYNFDVDGYIAPDLTILAEHITEGNVVEMAYQEEPLAIIWCVRGDGQLIALTYQREQEVVAWHRHIIGGVFGTGNAVVESVAVIPTDDSEYELYMIVKRTINGATTRYVEYLHTFNFDQTDNTSFNYLDSQLGLSKSQTTLTAGINATATTVPVASVSGLSSSGKIKIGGEIISYAGISTLNLTGCTRGQNITTATSHLSGAVTKEVVNIIAGLNHLEGQTVSILVDGATHPTKVVASNSITLDRFGTDVKIGLQYTSILKTMRIDAGSQDGTSQGKTKRIFEVTARLFETVGVEVGPDLDNMERVPFRTSADPMDQGIPPFTGDKEVEFRGNYDTDGFMMVRQTQPLPLTLLSLYPRLVTNDG